MQRLLECPICLNYYDTSARLPKTLLCGHGFCSACLTDLVVQGTVKCPKCRQDCTLSGGSVRNLPTSFAMLDMLDTSCESCRDQPWTHRCHHCSRNLCDKCETSHLDSSVSSSGTEVKALKEAVAKLKFLSKNDNILKQIKTHGENTIGQINRTYSGYVEELKHHNQKLVSKVQEQMHKDTDAFLSWRDNVDKLTLELDHFIERSQAETGGAYGGQVRMTTHIIRQHIDTIKSVTREKPGPTKVTFIQHPDRLDRFLSECGKVTIHQVDIPTAPSVSGTSKQKTIPDYALATFKSEIKLNEYCWPWALAIFPQSGEFIVTDNLNATVQLHQGLPMSSAADRSGQSLPISNFHGADKPFGVTVSHTKNIYITDQANHCIHVLDKSGQPINKFGRYGDGPGQFNTPNGLALNNQGLIYICDGKNYRVQVFREDGLFSHILCHSDISQTAQFSSMPFFIAVSSDTVVVSDFKGQLYVISTDGRLLRELPAKQPPHGVDATGVSLDRHGNIILADQGGHLHVLHPGGQHMCTVGSVGEGPGQLKDPRGIVVTHNNDIAVCDMSNHRIHFFSVPSKVIQ